MIDEEIWTRANEATVQAAGTAAVGINDWHSWKSAG
jgi:hypothetical protein